MTGEIIIGSLLGWYGVSDLRKKEIPVVHIILGFIVIGICCVGKKHELIEILTGILPGLGMLLLALITTEKIGYADGIIVILIGAYIGTKDCLQIVWLALVFLIMAFFVIAIKEKRMKHVQLPFIPFLFFSWIFKFFYSIWGGVF